MWKFWKCKEGAGAISGAVMAAIVISTISLVLAAGVARWSWLMLDEQIQLRKDFEKLKNDQAQTQIQYEFWLQKLQKEREAGKQ